MGGEVDWEKIENEIRTSSRMPCVDRFGKWQDTEECIVCGAPETASGCPAEDKYKDPEWIITYLRERERCRGV